METPLARPLKSLQRQMRESPHEFELDQLLRIMRLIQPNSKPLVSFGPYLPGEADVHRIVPPSHNRAGLIELNSASFPKNHAEAVVAACHRIWERACPFASSEPRDQREFLGAAIAFADISSAIGVPAETVAFASACLRRRTDLAGLCAEYFDVPVRFNAVTGNQCRLRFGPLTYDQYQELHPQGSAGKLAAAFARAMLGPAVDIEIELVLKASDVPACVPATEGAIVGLTAWPRARRGHRQTDAVQTFPATTWTDQS